MLVEVWDLGHLIISMKIVNVRWMKWAEINVNHREFFVPEMSFYVKCNGLFHWFSLIS